MQKHLDPNPPGNTKQFAGHANEEIVLCGKEEKNQGHTQRQRRLSDSHVEISHLGGYILCAPI